MALQKTIETGSGHTVSYLHIFSAKLTLNGYIDQAHRRAGKYRPEIVEVKIRNDGTNEAAISALYEIIDKLAPEMADAEPVLEEGQRAST